MFPQLNPIQRQQIMTDTFRGYYHRTSVPDGMFWDTENVTADEYPVMATRKPRGYMATLNNPFGMIAKDALAYLDNQQGTVKLYYNGNAVTFNAGVSISSSNSMLPKRLVSMGAYIIVFPDGVYYNTQNATDNGYLAASFTLGAGAQASFQPCRMDGTIYEDVTVSPTAPASPENGDLWLDTSAGTHYLMQYSSSQMDWISITTVYTRIGATNIGKAFENQDGVAISGVDYSGDDPFVAMQADQLNGSHVLYDKGDDYIVVVGLIDESFTQTGGLKVERSVPKMDWVIESGNRLWGCRYGLVNGVTVNELYSCKLGDPKNWECYQGISTDSYRVSLGSDGQFTGAITYQGYPTFFKENCIHRVYGQEPSNYQVVTQEFRGVQKDCGGSLAIVGQTLYYKSRTDVCAYDGSAPVSVSDALGDQNYYYAVGGAWGEKYVIAMQDAAMNGNSHMFVYDTRGGIWTREDDTAISCAAHVGQELYIIDGNNKLFSMGGTAGTKETKIAWAAETGIQTYTYRKKRLARINIRAQIANYASLTVYFEYDSKGGWVRAGTVKGTGLTRTVHFFVVPRRCDHLRMKLEGTNTTRVFSISRVLEEASDL
jgi:hypothetical protein